MSKEFIVPTGKIIKEYLDENGISQKELSVRIGISEKHISNLLNGNSRLTEDLALKLEKVIVSVPATYWLNYETSYREMLARDAEIYKLMHVNLDEVAKKFRFKEVFEGLELTLVEQAVEMLKLLKISDFENFNAAYADIVVDFMEDGGEKEAIAVWLSLCESEIEIQNSDIDRIEYSSNQLVASLNMFKKIAYNSNVDLSISSCRKLCNKLGIYLVICEAITNSKVRGALTSYRGHPAIYLSGRYRSHDNIWFAFVHEIGHLLKHYNKKDTIVSYEDSESSKDSKEQEATQFARDFFINPESYEEFISENQFTTETIKKFAKKENINSGIVVARLQHDKKIGYEKFSHLKK